jgi:hypothetical protein
MSARHGGLWGAYLDGELSAKDSQGLQDSMTAAQRRRLEAEMRLEAALADAVATEAQCPASLWHAVQGRLKSKRREGTRRLGGWEARWWWIGGAATCLGAAVIWWAAQAGLEPVPAFLTNAASTTELAAVAEVSSDLWQVRSFLDAHGIALTLLPVSALELPAGHAASLVGARAVQDGGEEIVELLYECCGEPVKLVVAHCDSRAADRIQAAARKGHIRARRQVADYEVGLVSAHDAGELLNLLV